MPPAKTYGWLETDRIAEALADAHPGTDPLAVKFVDLRRMIEALPGFKEEPGHPVNERILESVQMAWVGEREERSDDD